MKSQQQQHPEALPAMGSGLGSEETEPCDLWCHFAGVKGIVGTQLCYRSGAPLQDRDPLLWRSHAL